MTTTARSVESISPSEPRRLAAARLRRGETGRNETGRNETRLGEPGRRRGRRTWWRTVLMHDLALMKLHTGLRMLVCLPAGLAAGYAVSTLVGLPIAVGLMLGALPAFLTCFIITDDRASRVAGRSAVVFIPFVLALFGSLALHNERFLELALMVVLLFLQFYANRFGVWAADFTTFLFAAYLCGLLLPLPLTSFEGLAAVGAASLAATIVVRSVFFRPNAFRALLRTRRAVAGWSALVIESSVEVLEAESSAPRTRERSRLHHRLARLHNASLVADGLLSQRGSGLHGAAAEHFHRLLFDLELAIDGIGRTAEALAASLAEAAARPTPSTAQGSLRAAVAAALRSVDEHGGRVAAASAGSLEEWMHDNPPSDADAASELRPGIHRLVGLLYDLQRSADEWTELTRTLHDHTDEPFESSIALVAGRVAGAVPILGDTLAEGGMTGPWGRWRISAPLRTAVQAAIAVAIVEPLAFWLGADRFYWGVIGVMVILAGTNTTHERVRKVVSRGVGTVAGAVLGILAVDALGTTHVWLSLALIVVSLAIGAYWFSSSYWVWVVCLVVAICQVYAFAGQFEDALLPLRLAENMLGATVAVIVSLVVLPVATGAMIRTATRRQLVAVGRFVNDVSRAASAAVPAASSVAVAASASASAVSASAELPRLRADARALDQENASLNAVMRPLVRRTSSGPFRAPARRDDETRALLQGITASARTIASRPDLDAPLSASESAAVAAAASRLVSSIETLVVGLGGSGGVGGSDGVSGSGGVGGSEGSEGSDESSGPRSSSSSEGAAGSSPVDDAATIVSAAAERAGGSSPDAAGSTGAERTSDGVSTDLPEQLRELAHIEAAVDAIARLHDVTVATV